jgi:hypothetical protein
MIQQGRQTMSEISGSCLCGKIRFTANAEPGFVGVCHCRNCQRNSGSAFAVVLGFPAGAVSTQGELKTYIDTGESGKSVFRQFFPDCGSSISSEAEVMPGMIMLKAGSMDDSSVVKPVMQIYCDSAQPWVSLGGELKSFPQMPG